MKETEIENILKTKIGVRYYEDGIVNGERDISYEDQKRGVIPKMPCVVKEGKDLLWCLEINVENGQILNWPKGNTAKVHYKVCDCCGMTFFVRNEEYCNNEDKNCGYVPDFLDRSEDKDSYGDYIIIEIDENGMIKNWSENEFYQWANKDED